MNIKFSQILTESINNGDLYVVEFEYKKFNTLRKKVCVAYYEDDGGDEGGRWFNNTTDQDIDVTKIILNLKTYV